SLNRYTYAHNNPVMFFDPSGYRAQKNISVINETSNTDYITFEFSFAPKIGLNLKALLFETNVGIGQGPFMRTIHPQTGFKQEGSLYLSFMDKAYFGGEYIAIIDDKGNRFPTEGYWGIAFDEYSLIGNANQKTK